MAGCWLVAGWWLVGGWLVAVWWLLGGCLVAAWWLLDAAWCWLVAGRCTQKLRDLANGSR